MILDMFEKKLGIDFLLFSAKKLASKEKME